MGCSVSSIDRRSAGTLPPIQQLGLPVNPSRGSDPPTRRGQLSTEPTLDGANQALGRFADLYATGQIPEYQQIVDTIVAWGEEILAYHTTERVSNGPLEGINNLLQVLRRVAHGFTNYHNYAARGILVT